MSDLPNAVRNGWMQTFTGRAFFPANPNSDDIHIEDIANSLGRQCRFAGHCLYWYSVAEHCVHLCDAATQENKLTALMHDASEAYLIDIPRPVKPLLKEYAGIESHLMNMIAHKYGFSWPLPDEVKRLDLAILTDEREQNMAPMSVHGNAWGNSLPALGIQLRYWNPARASLEFLDRFSILTGGE